MKLLSALCIVSIIAMVLLPSTSAFFFSNIKHWLAVHFHKASTNNKPAQHLTGVPKEIVDKHNEYRRSVKPTARDMLEMRWSSKVAANAQKWADHCSSDHFHSSDSSRVIGSTQCGENVYRSTAKVSWSQAIESWYNEVKDYSYDKRRSINGKPTGHYTQVVWADSNEVGCGMAYCPNLKYKYNYVCQYCPAGNYAMEPPYKKGKTCGDCPLNCDKGLCTKI